MADVDVIEKSNNENKKIIDNILGNKYDFKGKEEFLSSLNKPKNGPNYSNEEINEAMVTTIETKFNSSVFSGLPEGDKEKFINLKKEFTKNIQSDRGLELGEQFKKFSLIFETINGIEGAISASYKRQDNEYRKLVVETLKKYNSQQEFSDEKIRELRDVIENINKEANKKHQESITNKKTIAKNLISNEETIITGELKGYPSNTFAWGPDYNDTSSKNNPYVGPKY